MENVTVQLAKPKTTPKDFFLWLFAMVALYISVGSFIALIFRYIEVLFPDPVFYGYDPYSGGMRFAIAALVVFFPLYFVITGAIQKDLRKNPEKQELGIRKWLIYITLFFAGLTLAGDLVAVLYTFLGGDLTVRFLLKAVTIFGVIGLVFWYYFADLKGTWVQKASLSKMVGIGAGAVILLSIIGGFFIVGSPMTQRDLRIDAERAQDLQEIQWQIINYWTAKGTLPQNLDGLTDSVSGFSAPVDPVTGQSYVYRTTGPQTFELCATFTLPSKETDYSRAYPYGMPEDNWVHGTGETCFTRTIDPDRYPVKPDSVIKPIPAAV